MPRLVTLLAIASVMQSIAILLLFVRTGNLRKEADMDFNFVVHLWTKVFPGTERSGRRMFGRKRKSA